MTEERARTPMEDLEGLIALAEKSISHIDFLVQKALTGRVKLLASYLATGLLVATGMLYFLGIFAQQGAERKDIYIQIIIIAAIGGIVFGGSFITLLQSRSLKRLRRDTLLEYDVIHRLTSLIDDQFRMVAIQDGVSTVQLATLEIRIRRLDRSSDRPERL